jgi:hypothetical protein
MPAGTSCRSKGMRQMRDESASAGLRLIPSVCSVGVVLNGRITGGMEEAYMVDNVGGHGTEGDYDLEQAGDSTADVLGGALGDVGVCDSRDTADARDGDNVTRVNEPEAQLSGGSDGR